MKRREKKKQKRKGKGVQEEEEIRGRRPFLNSSKLFIIYKKNT